MKKQDVPVPPLPKPQVFIAYLGDDARDEAVKLTATLRRSGIGAVVALGEKSLKAQLRQANNLGIHYAVIIGEQEVMTATAILRDMTTAEQKPVPLSELPELLG